MTIEYDQLAKNKANHVPLSPISFLHRTADIYPHIESLIYHERRDTWRETRERCVKFASSLAARGFGKNERVLTLYRKMDFLLVLRKYNISSSETSRIASLA